MQKDFFLTVGITSYNRVDELIRCVKSIESKYCDDIEILICEDKSPKRAEIKAAIEKYIPTSKQHIVFHENVNNLGYDRNVKNIIDTASGKYVLLMSDDDSLIPGALDKIIEKIRGKEYNLIYSPYHNPTEDVYKRRYGEDQVLDKAKEYLKTHIYDAILFSGLIFNKEFVKGIDSERFLNTLYIQVYMFMYCVYNGVCFYCEEPLVSCIGDGENGFGLSDSSVKDELLANRKSVFSNLKYHEGLFSVIKMFDEDFGADYFKCFLKDYRIRTFIGLSTAKNINQKTMKEYYKMLKNLGVKLGLLPKIYYALLTVFGVKISTTILSIPKKIFIHRRKGV